MQKYLQWKDKSMAKKEEKQKESYKLKEDLFSRKKNIIWLTFCFNGYKLK